MMRLESQSSPVNTNSGSVVTPYILERQLGRVAGLKLIDAGSMDLTVADPSFVDRHLKTLVYGRDVERNVSIYEQQIMALIGRYSMYTSRFLNDWGQQEPRHGDVHEAVILQGTTPVDELPVYAAEDLDFINKFMLGGFFAHHSERFSRIADFLVSVIGAGHETTVKVKYNWLKNQAEAAGEQNIANAMAEIIPQEAEHDAWYRTYARYLKQSMSQRDLKATKFLLQHIWTPVGVESAHHKIGFGLAATEMVAGGVSLIDLINRLEKLFSNLLEADNSELVFLRQAIGDCIDMARTYEGRQQLLGALL